MQVRLTKMNALKVERIHLLNRKRYPGAKLSDSLVVNLNLSDALDKSIKTLEKEVKEAKA
jgi:hypothetical protein